MNVALKSALSAADLNFNPPAFSPGQLRDCTREHWGLEGELAPLDGERDQNHRLTTADGANYVLKVSAAGDSEGAVDFQVAALRHLERHATVTLVSGIIFHGDLGDPGHRIHLLKNLSIAGGFLLVIAHGPGRISLDRRAGIRGGGVADT